MGNLNNKINRGIYRELIIEIDYLGNIVAISDNCYNILGYNSNEISGVNIRNFILEGDINLHEEESSFELTFIDKVGEYKYFDVFMHTIIDDKHQITGAILSLIDISRFRSIREKQEKILKILELSKDIIYMVEIEPEQKMIYINPAVEENLGISIEENYKNPNRAYEAAHPDDKDKFIMKKSGELDYSKPIQVRYKNVNGEYIWFEESVIPIYDNKRKLIVLIGFCRNIQERKAMEDELKKVSFYDSLTGIWNRSYFQREINELNTVRNEKIGMIICDLDNLKYINDNFGHPQGDELLKEFSRILESYTSKTIISARIGGDEFVLLSKGESYDFVEKLYHDLLKSIDEYNLKIKYKVVPLSVSVGFAYSESSIGLTQQVYNIADSKMYEHKSNSKKYINYSGV